jgi:hypothetical protein
MDWGKTVEHVKPMLPDSRTLTMRSMLGYRDKDKIGKAGKKCGNHLKLIWQVYSQMWRGEKRWDLEHGST